MMVHQRKDMMEAAKGVYGSLKGGAERELWDKRDRGFTEMMARCSNV